MEELATYITIYQATHGAEANRDTYYALVGLVRPDSIQTKRPAVVLQPLKKREAVSALESDDDESKYVIDNIPVVVPEEVFLGSYRTGQPNYELIEALNDASLVNMISKANNLLTFQASIDYLHIRDQAIRTDMLHLLGWYRNRTTLQVVRFLGVSTHGTQILAVLQDSTGSLDPVWLYPVQGIDPVTEDGVKDIWNAIHLIPLSEFTATEWVTDDERVTCYEYLGQDYREGDLGDGLLS